MRLVLRFGDVVFDVRVLLEFFFLGGGVGISILVDIRWGFGD